MYDYGLSVLEQYGLSAVRSWRGRGALLCQTQNGLVMIREFNGSETKLKYQRALLQKIHLPDRLSVSHFRGRFSGQGQRRGSLYSAQMV